MSPALIANSSKHILFIYYLVILALFYYGADENYLILLNHFYQAFSCVMILDTIIKLLAYGIVRYFGYSWRKIEFVLSLISLLDLAIDLIIYNWTKRYFQ